MHFYPAKSSRFESTDLVFFPRTVLVKPNVLGLVYQESLYHCMSAHNLCHILCWHGVITWCISPDEHIFGLYHLGLSIKTVWIKAGIVNRHRHYFIGLSNEIGIRGEWKFEVVRLLPWLCVNNFSNIDQVANCRELLNFSVCKQISPRSIPCDLDDIFQRK